MDARIVNDVMYAWYLVATTTTTGSSVNFRFEKNKTHVQLSLGVRFVHTKTPNSGGNKWQNM